MADKIVASIENKEANVICQNKADAVTDANVSGEILLMMLLLSLSLGGGHYLKKLKIKFINESLLAMIIGVIAGAILQSMENEKYINNISSAYVNFFIIILLPTIIFESAYNMRRKEFFKNLGSILIYSVFGTLISILFTGFSMWAIGQTGMSIEFSLKESLIYGSLISATDPVSILSAFKDYSTDPNFFQLIYGESILNDAVSIVFYDTCLSLNSSHSMRDTVLFGVLFFLLNFIGSIILGILIGFLTAVILKIISGKVRNIEKIEISLMVILPWVAYLSAQMMNLSGIVSLLFNGVAHATYTKPNLSDWSKITIKTSYESVSHLFETLIFIFLGIGFFSFHHHYNRLTFGYVIIMILVILIARFLNIIICTVLANFFRRENKVDKKKQFLLIFSGVRGAMAFALSIKTLVDLPSSGPTFLVLTIIVISFTLLYSSVFIDYVLKKCGMTNFCQADNFEDSTLRPKGCFESIKIKMEYLNQKYLMPLVYRDNKEEAMKNSVMGISVYSPDFKINTTRIRHMALSPTKLPLDKHKNFSERSEQVTLDRKNFKVEDLNLFDSNKETI